MKAMSWVRFVARGESNTDLRCALTHMVGYLFFLMDTFAPFLWERTVL